MSRGFIAALAGIAMTLFAWFGPWEWPAWPAFVAIKLLFGGNAALAERPFNERAWIVVALIVINSAFWAGVTSSVVHFFATRWRISTAGREKVND